ncbi:hypothetical protein [Methanopyrus kandleri]|uniref:Uncharacterized protein n=2 Tax=Methanopyrus kandleri TaxID=2320 RepID=Q8TWV8_METKA|nr:hypothetical protein [Methanopyrus kandleri]AAM02136.1 Uncharacterized protein MK0923 [Methanopyrus kandleri AV19]HII69849.1 hypothetical protein [Methanopyrus kandleri]
MIGLFRGKRREIDYSIDRRELIEVVCEIRDVRNSFAHVREDVGRPDEKAQNLVKKVKEIIG